MSGGATTERKVEMKKERRAARKRKMQEKYMRYLHLILPKQTVIKAPKIAKKLNPIRVP